MKGRSIRKMVGGAINAVCPPGFFCMDTGFIIFVSVVLLALLVGVFIYTQSRNNINGGLQSLDKNSVKVIIERVRESDASENSERNTGSDVKPKIRPFAQDAISGSQHNSGAPAYRSMDIPQPTNRPQSFKFPPPPERSYETPVDTAGFYPPPGIQVVPIQVPTQGLPQEFQQVGVLSTPGGSSTSASPNRTLLPLFGRRVAVSRERYNYYTRTDGFNPVQVPVSFKNRNCEDDNGCDEISNGDMISVPLLGQTFVSTVYRYNIPRYIPVV